MKCYYHRDYLGNGKVETGEELFCNKEEAELWADKTYGKKGESKSSRTIQEMQEKLLKMGKDQAEKGFRN